MNIELKQIKIRDLVKGYNNDEESGRVVGYDSKLDIRPSYQREFIYKDKQREAVIDTIFKGFPLNVMYWAVREDGSFEVIDGQQRTIPLCQFVSGDFAFDFRYFHNLQKDEQEKFLDYDLMVYFCSGTDSEKLSWFRTINIAGEKLTDQELLNAVYAGPWVNDAKRYFSKNGCAAQKIAADFLNGSAIRQEYLETAISWIANGHVEGYMAIHQFDQNAGALWRYFQNVIEWVKTTFNTSKSRLKLMKGQDWGTLYNDFKDKLFDTEQLEEETQKLLLDDDVTNKRGIYHYLLTRKEKYLSIRSFSEAQKISVYEKQNGKCANPKCPDAEKFFEISEMEADHITPWSEGGKTELENCQMLCRECNRRKGKS